MAFTSVILAAGFAVSMESGLEDRNNYGISRRPPGYVPVSMESGLEDRNNDQSRAGRPKSCACLNGVRPRRPEQYANRPDAQHGGHRVSMESGLEDRNNLAEG